MCLISGDNESEVMQEIVSGWYFLWEIGVWLFLFRQICTVQVTVGGT